MRTLFSLTLLLTACQFDGSTSAKEDGSTGSRADTDPNAPDAAPNAPDADPNAPDAMPCSIWAQAPSILNPCSDIEMVDIDLDMSLNSTYVFNTDDGILKTVPDMIEVATYTSQLVPMSSSDPNAPRALIANNFVIGADARLRVVGSRPALLVAWQSMTITGTIDVSSNHNLAEAVGAGANPAACTTATKGTDDTEGAAGGGGGGFGSKGGDGFAGGKDLINTTGGIGGAAASVSFRGGCPGAVGGTGSATETLVQSEGGGAIHLMARTTLTVGGLVHAGGAGGQRAITKRAGGSGGGSGGYIGLEAHTLTILATATITANGGGGSGGAKESPSSAEPGKPGQTDRVAAIGGDGEPFGRGGNGGFGDVVDGQNGEVGDRGSGGGGGGVGFIIRVTNVPTYDPQATFSPDAIP